jgi:hypothetical protein
MGNPLGGRNESRDSRGRIQVVIKYDVVGVYASAQLVGRLKEKTSLEVPEGFILGASRGSP